MTHDELRRARETLCLTWDEMAALTETDVTSVKRWERDPALSTSRQPPARAERLIRAYLSGYRPTDWPEAAEARERSRAEAAEELRTVRNNFADTTAPDVTDRVYPGDGTTG